MTGDPRLRDEARLTAPEFVAHYQDLVRRRRIRIGCSFSPEYLGADGEGATPEAHARALRALRTAIDDLGMTEIRLGLRWDNLAPDGVAITDFYAPYLDLCFNHPAVRSVALDIGPLKTYRWPEIHVPDPVLDRLTNVPSGTAEITPRMEVARLGLEHARRTVDYLGREYDGAKPVTISLNEPFHGFGRFRWTMSETYLIEILDVVFSSGYFRDAGVLINSAQGLDLRRIAAFFELLVRRRPEFRGRLTSGFDIYPFLPPVTDFPVFRELLGNIRARRRHWDGQVATNFRDARHPDYGYRIEVTEAQAEPFGTHPAVGNSLPHFLHVLAQCFDRILDPDQDESVIRLFGIEYQLQRLFDGDATADNLAILDVTRSLNRLTA